MAWKYLIGLWGQYGDGGVIADGQAVRTTIITKELEQRYGKENILILNTNNWQKHPVKFLWDSIMLVAKAKSVVIFPADNGFKVIVPIISFMNLFYHRQLLDVVIGGYLPALLKGHKYYIRKLKKFQALFVQTPNIKKDLEELGLNNIRYLTNLKRLTPVPKDSIIVHNEKELKLCLFSRITEDKGVLDAVEAIKLANDQLGYKAFTLDIYGIIGPAFKDRFDEVLAENEGLVLYKGVANYNETVDVLKDYFALVFPTYFHGEGFPGCFIDAFHAGIPVVATDWLYNKDLIEPEVNGLLVPIKSPEMLSKAFVRLYHDRELAHQMGLNNLMKSKEYTPEAVLGEFYTYFDSEKRV